MPVVIGRAERVSFQILRHGQRWTWTDGISHLPEWKTEGVDSPMSIQKVTSVAVLIRELWAYSTKLPRSVVNSRKMDFWQ